MIIINKISHIHYAYFPHSKLAEVELESLLINHLKYIIHKGFSLIELVISLGIVSVLIMVAEPQYNNYVAKAQVIEAVNIITGARVAVIEHKATHGRWPTIQELTQIYPLVSNIYAKTKYIQELYNSSDNGINGKYSISVVFKTENISSLIAGNELHFSTSFNSSGSNWVCESEIRQDALPSSCIGI